MKPRPLVARLVILVILVLAVVFLAGGCGPARETLGSRSAVPSTGPPSAATAMISTPEAAPSAPAAAPSAPAPTASLAAEPSVRAGLRVDPRLLDVLPLRIDGVPLAPDPTTAGQIATDPSLAGFAEAIAVAFAVSSGTSSGDDLAIVSVLRLRPGIFSEPWFRIYRDSYDAAACQVAGGVQGQPSQIQIAGRTAYVGTCAGEAHTYHVHLADPTLIVSLTAAGPRAFGELVVAGLAE